LTRRAPAAIAIVVAAVALVVIGRWERSRHVDNELRGLRDVRAAVGPLDNSSLDSYRVSLVPFDCLLYRRDSNRYALELCVDEDGRLVEAFDRRNGFHVWSLREEPTASTVRVDRHKFDRMLRKLGVPPGVNQGPRGQ
jgi:hypothetical protein